MASFTSLDNGQKSHEKTSWIGILMGAILLANAPAFAAGPNVLQHGESVTFPTWAGDSATTLCVQSLSNNHGVRIAVNAGAGHEEVYAPANKTQCIKRKWWAVQIGVTNTTRNDADAKVWTY